MTVLRVILGDQLNLNISSLRGCQKTRDHILLCEVWDEATYVRHHKKKIAFLFSAMRHFADELKQEGYRVTYVKLDDPANSGSFRGEVSRIAKQLEAENIVVTFPGEYRVLQDMQGWQVATGLSVEIRPDERFMCTPEEFASWADGRKNLRMEFFYREMRKKYHLLVDGDQPFGNQWNFDEENRKPPPGGALLMPLPLTITPDTITQEVMALVAERFGDHFGDLEPFYFAVTRSDALRILKKFITERLAEFGTYQDAMLTGQPWMYHAHISFYLNCGLLDPLEVAQAAEVAYLKKKVPLNAAEGFIRQIIGWREFVRGIYWLKMPDYAAENALNATRKLPWFYWSGETEMNCLHQCITETKQNAYAHHIQRLMLLGNFALLAGLDPDEVNEWYLIVYADAYEWVELPNVTGMILFADGGYLASKPYAASGAYINRMSDYCKGCRYDVNKKSGPDACPFNYLYWDFFQRNRAALSKNPRIGMAYRTLDKMDPAKIKQVRADAARFLDSLESDAP